MQAPEGQGRPQAPGCPWADALTQSEPVCPCGQTCVWLHARASVCVHTPAHVSTLPSRASVIRNSSLTPLASGPSSGMGHTEGPTLEPLLPTTRMSGGVGITPMAPTTALGTRKWRQAGPGQAQWGRDAGVHARVGLTAPAAALPPPPPQARRWGRRSGWFLPSPQGTLWLGNLAQASQAWQWPSPRPRGPWRMDGPLVKPRSSFLANVEARLSERSQSLCPEVRGQEKCQGTRDLASARP